MHGYAHLFVPGPTNVPEPVRQAMNLPMEDMRAPDFGAFVTPLLDDLRQVFRTRTGRVFVFPSSGTGAWEAAFTNTLSAGDKVLMSRFGQFSGLWVEMAERLGLRPEVVDVEWGKGVPVADYARILGADRAHEIRAVCVTQNETATGVTSDVQAVRAVLDDLGHPALLLVDGVSSIASIPFEMEAWGVDLAVAGSQKGFMLPAGLGLLGVSEKALEAARTATLRRAYFEFSDMIRLNDTGYFPYTPATQLLRGLRVSVDMLLAEGMEAVWTRQHHLAEGVRAAVQAWNGCAIVAAPGFRSDTVTTIRVPDGVDAIQVIRTAYERYRTSLGAGLARLSGKAFRIGHLGSLNEVMLLGAIGAAEMALLDSGARIEAGSGLAAAITHYRNAGTAQQKAA